MISKKTYRLKIIWFYDMKILWHHNLFKSWSHVLLSLFYITLSYLCFLSYYWNWLWILLLFVSRLRSLRKDLCLSIIHITATYNFYDTMCIFKYLKMPVILMKIINYGEYLWKIVQTQWMQMNYRKWSLTHQYS